MGERDEVKICEKKKGEEEKTEKWRGNGERETNKCRRWK